MEHHMTLQQIGRVAHTETGPAIHIDEQYRQGLGGLDGYSHVQIVWWGSLTDTDEHRRTLELRGLFKKGPHTVGVFATRAPVRPNPLLISTVAVRSIDADHGIIAIPFIDANDGTPVLDIKPYNPMERIRNCSAPDWCRHWPQWQEEAAGFDWAEEIAM